VSTHPDIPVAISARHVHLTPATIEQLFGRGYALRVHAPLSQPGQYAAEETVTLVGPKGELAHVRVVGPPRHADQVEISRSDEVLLGIDAPVRTSGKLGATPGIKIVGPGGEVNLPHGVVIAKRHIHMNPQDAERLGVRDHEVVQVAVHSDGRDLIFGDVVIRVSPDYRLELHLDTDEGNAAALHAGDRALLLTPTHARARLHNHRIASVERGRR